MFGWMNVLLVKLAVQSSRNRNIKYIKGYLIIHYNFKQNQPDFVT